MFHSAVPFCGVFLCRNDEGNAQLRAMEPPRARSLDPDFPEKGANKHDREGVPQVHPAVHRNLSIKDESKVIAVPELVGSCPTTTSREEDDSRGPEQSDEDQVEGFPSKPPKPTDRKELAVSTSRDRGRECAAWMRWRRGSDDGEAEGGGGDGRRRWEWGRQGSRKEAYRACPLPGIPKTSDNAQIP